MCDCSVINLDFCENVAYHQDGIAVVNIIIESRTTCIAYIFPGNWVCLESQHNPITSKISNAIMSRCSHCFL